MRIEKLVRYLSSYSYGGMQYAVTTKTITAKNDSTSEPVED